MALHAQHTLAVLDDSLLLTYNYRNRQYGNILTASLPPCEGLHSLWEICHKGAIETLWLTPGSFFSREVKQLQEQGKGIVVVSESRIKDGSPRWILINRPGSGHQVKLAFPEYDDRWPWRTVTRADALLASVITLEDAVEARIEWGPGHVGQELMLQFNDKHRHWFEPIIMPKAIIDHPATDKHWKRPLTNEEKKSGMWYHFFDKASAHLGSCTGANLGEGQPEHVLALEGGNLFREHPIWNLKVPGAWRVDDEWIWTPELEYRLKDDPEWRPRVSEAYVWPVYHQLLRSWGEHMWDSRGVLRMALVGHESYDLTVKQALEAHKSIYVQGLGWLNFSRPDWASMITAGTLRSTGIKKVQMREKMGKEACYWNVDMLGFVSWGKSLAPYQEYMLNRVGCLGGFSRKKSVRMTSAKAAVFMKDAPWQACQAAVLAWEDEWEDAA